MRTQVSNTGIAAAAMAAVLSMACEKPAAAPPPPTEVYVAEVIQKDVPVYLELVGQTAGFQDAEIRARVEGFLESMNFREGSFVARGALLYEIDRKPLEAILAQARADQATAEAVLAKANNDVARYTPLVAKQAVSQQELDDAKAQQDASRSQVEAAKSAVEKADARPQLYAGHLADRRTGREPRWSSPAISSVAERTRCSPPSRRSIRSSSASA